MSDRQPNQLVVLITQEHAGKRADRALSDMSGSLSRRTMQNLCERGRVTCRGRVVGKAELVRGGDEFLILLDPERRAVEDFELELAVRYESRDWVVVSKPALQPTAPTNGLELNTLANALVARYPELAHVGHHPLEPGLLHRLDNGTSGLVVAARSRTAFDAATRALKRGLWTKSYLALVQATQLPRSGTIVGKLRADRRHRRRVELAERLELIPESPWQGPTRGRQGCAALEHDGSADSSRHTTRFRVVSEFEETTYVEVTVGAAFRHQIRAHFAFAGWPLVNDELYGARRDLHLEHLRHALHAARVAWPGCDDVEGFDVCEPLSEDLARLLDVVGREDS
ncbi:MAG TPA: RluA family pseudouridine synthase [Polyangiaceae bacterium]|nr:RluA family pseudouridine synthase [Polyangiaceae bacterium]